MKRMVSRIVGTLVVLVVLAAIVVAFLPQPVAVDAAVIERGPMQVTVDEDGRTRIREKYIVSAPLAGQLQRIQLLAGDAVQTGQTTIARIDPSDPALLDARAIAEAEARVRRAQAAVRRSDADLERARADVDYMEDELARVNQAADRGAATPREVDQAMTGWRRANETYNAARFEQEIATFELDLAEAALLRSRPQDDREAHDFQLTISAPIDGRVLRVFQESMAVVQAGTPLVELGDPTDLEIVVDVLSTDAVRIPPGAKVYIEYWGGEKQLHARVRLVEPQAFTKVSSLGVEEQRVNVILEFDNPAEDRATLGDGYRVEARIVIWEHEDVIRVPTSALFRDTGEWAVFVIEDDRAVLRHVKLGRQTGLFAQAIAGLSEGEIVIIHPGDRVEHQVRITKRQ